jgi:hypothetical protein
MSQVLSNILNDLEDEYLQHLNASEKVGTPGDAYRLAARLCYQQLFLTPDVLASVIQEDPTILAARAGDLVKDPEEQSNPSVGVIICSNIIEAALENLLSVAYEQGWLDIDDEGRLMVDTSTDGEILTVPTDYSRSQMALDALSQPSPSRLNRIFQSAEQEYIDQLESGAHDAYSLALEVSGNHAIFAPEDIAPLIEENPLLLGLRPDELMDDDMFAGDPPAGIVISGHLTSLLLEQLLMLAEERGCLAYDSTGAMIVPDTDEDKPVIH